MRGDFGPVADDSFELVNQVRDSLDAVAEVRDVQLRDDGCRGVDRRFGTRAVALSVDIVR
jgi:hypothetical protein